MSDICVGCTPGTIPQQYYDCVDYFRKIGAKYFALLKCDWVPADITDIAEWQTALANGDVICSPPGSAVINSATFTTFDKDLCGGKANADIFWPVDFTTYQAAADLSDYTFWDAIYSNAASYRLMVVDCNGAWIVSDDYETATSAPGKSPGFAFNMLNIPSPQAGDANLAQWFAQFEIPKEGTLKRRFLPGVAAAICPAG